MSTKGKVTGIVSNLVTVAVDGPVAENELCYITVGGGFSIGPKDGSWFVSMTDETFRDLIAEYLRPVTRKFLFG